MNLNPEHDPGMAQAIREDLMVRRGEAVPTPPANPAAGPWPYPVAIQVANRVDLVDAPAGSFGNFREGNIVTGCDGIDGLEVVSVCVNLKMPKEQADKLRHELAHNVDQIRVMLVEVQHEAKCALNDWFRVESEPLRP